MDKKQKDLIQSPKMIDLIDFEEIIEPILSAKLLTEDKIKDIKDKASSSYVRVVKLLYALIERDSPTAFDDFVGLLEITNNVEALNMVSPLRLNNGQSPIDRSRGMVRKLADIFYKNKSNHYPFGLSSCMPNTSTAVDQAPFQGDINCSPLKEKHQATLISSRSPTNTCDSGFRLTNSTASSTPLFNRGPTTPPTTSYQHNNNKRLQEFVQQQARSSQTPSRAHLRDELMLNNLSLSDDQGEHSSADREPLVCWHPYVQSQPGNLDPQLAHSPHFCHPSHSSASSESDSSSDSIIIDPTLIMDPNVTLAIARDGAKMMSVKRANVCHNNIEEDYKMTARPRGPCLIVNNIDFEEEIFPTRKGSDEDARRFDDIFQQLGFTVIVRRNQTADKMRQLFKEVAAQCRPEHDSLFVFILSHGSEHGIYGTDGTEVYLESEIISCFDNRNCKAMIGKPKVFVIQACRGRAKDCGGEGDMTDSIAWPSVTATHGVKTSQENRVPTSWLPSQPPDGKKRKHPIRTDMLLIFSCLAGFVSVRNELAGSWLGVALAYFIMTHAHERDLLRILNLVTNDVIQRESSHGHIQSIELKLLGWTKNLYFNPGIYL